MLLGARSSARNAAPKAPRLRSALAGALLACFTLSACGDEEPDGPSTAPEESRGRPPVSVTPEQQAEATRQQARVAQLRQAAAQRPEDPYANPEAYAKPDEEQAAEAEKEKPRDYAAELLSAVRGAESCVQPRVASDALPSELNISLEGLVLESGTVVSGTVRAPVLTPEEIECMKRRLQSSRLAGNVKDAPRRVTTSLQLKFKKQDEKPGAAAAPGTPAEAAPKAY